MISKERLTLDLKGDKSFDSLIFHRGDSNSRIIEIELTDNHVLKTLTDSMSATIDATINDIIVADSDKAIIDIKNNIISFTITEKMTSISGLLKISLTVTENSAIITAQTFSAIVCDSVINENSKFAPAQGAVKEFIDEIVKARGEFNDLSEALSNKLDNTSGSVSRENIASEAVGSNEIEAKAVTTEKLANKSVTSIKLSNSCVSANNIAENQINSAHLQAKVVTAEKLSDDVKNAINSKANKTDTYTKSEIDEELAKKINEEDVYTAEEVDERFQRILTAGDNIKIDDNKQGKITISADLSKKYDAANVESGSGDLSLYSENVPVTSAKFNYQKVGDFVMLTFTVIFSAATMSAAKSYSLLGLPYRNDIILRKPTITTSKNKLGIAIAANTATLTIITQGEAVAISDGESIQETLIYKIQK